MNDLNDTRRLIWALNRNEITSEKELQTILSNKELDWTFRILEDGQTLLQTLAWYPSLCTSPILDTIPPTAMKHIRNTNDRESTALHNASISSNVNLVKALFLYITNEILRQKNWEGRTAMEEAALRGNKEVLRIFLSRDILDAKVVRWCLAHCNVSRTTDVLEFVLNSSLPIYEDFVVLKKLVETYFDSVFLEMDDFDIEYYNAVQHQLDIGAAKQKRFREALNNMLLSRTALIPVLTSIVHNYIS